VPATEGVPVMEPVVGVRDMPGGILPEEMLKK